MLTVSPLHLEDRLYVIQELVIRNGLIEAYSQLPKFVTMYHLPSKLDQY